MLACSRGFGQLEPEPQAMEVKFVHRQFVGSRIHVWFDNSPFPKIPPNSTKPGMPASKSKEALATAGGESAGLVALTQYEGPEPLGSPTYNQVWSEKLPVTGSTPPYSTFTNAPRVLGPGYCAIPAPSTAGGVAGSPDPDWAAIRP